MEIRLFFGVFVCLTCVQIFLADDLQLINSTVCSPDSCYYDPGPFNPSFSCRYSNCTAIPQNIPIDVRKVNLMGNQIQNISDTLKDFDSLENLDLSMNRIELLSDDAFPLNLLSLNLSGNDLTLEDFAGKVSLIPQFLKILDLSENKIENLTVVDLFFSNSNYLKVLNLSGNRIESIERNAITDLRALEVLDLSRNRINVLEHEDFEGLQRLDVFNLSGNFLTSLPNRLFRGLNRARTVDVSNNRITEVNSSTFGDGLLYLSIETMHLEKNQLKVISSGQLQLPSLRNLYLDDNPLEKIESRVVGPNLVQISIQRCPSLKEIPDMISGETSALTKVVIRNNKQLRKISPLAFGGSDQSVVKELDISYNALTNLPDNLVNWASLTEINLSGNFWDCDCQMAWLKGVPNTSVALQQKIKCYNPRHLRDMNVADVDVTSFSCNIVVRYRRQGSIALAVGVTVLFISVIALVAYRCKHKFGCWYPSGKYENIVDFKINDLADDEYGSITMKKKIPDQPEAEAV